MKFKIPKPSHTWDVRIRDSCGQWQSSGSLKNLPGGPQPHFFLQDPNPGAPCQIETLISRQNDHSNTWSKPGMLDQACQPLTPPQQSRGVVVLPSKTPVEGPTPPHEDNGEVAYLLSSSKPRDSWHKRPPSSLDIVILAKAEHVPTHRNPSMRCRRPASTTTGLQGWASPRLDMRAQTPK